MYVERNPYLSKYSRIFTNFHIDTFNRLARAAPKFNLRIVAINRRDYKGSTLYSEEELNELSNSDSDGYKAFMRLRGLEIARFMVWYVAKEKLPQANQDGTGGIAVLGWSAGNMTTMAFMTHASSYPTEVVQALKPYFKTFFIYGEIPPVDNSSFVIEMCMNRG